MKCPNCKTLYSYLNGLYYANCYCNKTDDDIINTIVAVETVIETVETVEEIIDLFDE